MDELEVLKREIENSHATIAAQAVQIYTLEQEQQRRSGLGALRELLQLSQIVGTTVGHAPYRTLLSGIVEAARRLFDAGAASILLVDHETEELVFEAASGPSEVLGMRLPASKGIAGWVVMTGEPIATSDVKRDPRWAREFAASTGYMPNSLMAVPLLIQDEVEGVIEVLDKASSTSFGLGDLELLSLFARPAAFAVEQARMVTNIGSLLVEELGRLAEEHGDSDLARSARTALASGNATPDQTLELARIVHTLSRRGDRARQLAIEILQSIDRNSVV